MIESNNMFKTVVDKIDYDNFIDLVKKYQDKYNIYIKYSNSFDCFSYDEDLSFNIYINQDAELTLDDHEDNLLFFTINSKIKTNNIFTQFLGGKLSDSDFIEKLQKLVKNYNNRKISKIKQNVFSKKYFQLSSVMSSEEESLIYLLDDSFLIKISKEKNIYSSYYSSFLTKNKKNLGASYIIKFNNFINYGSNINYFINKKNLIHKGCDNIYFKEEAEKLFEYLEKFPDQSVSIEQYYLIIYGLYFKLFTSEELKIIIQLFKNTNQLYFYDSKEFPDFNKEFVEKLLLNNNITLKVEKKIYYEDVFYVSKNKYIDFYCKAEKLEYILYLIEDLMKSNFIILSEHSLYSDVKETLLNNLDFLNYKSGYTKNQLVRKINKYLTYDDKDE